MLKKSTIGDRLPGPSADLSALAPPGEPSGSRVTRLFGCEGRWLRRIFETVLPAESNRDLPIGGAFVPLGRFIDDLLAQAPLKFVTAHLFGTATMGRTRSNGVVGPELETHGVAGFYVVDSSVFPTNIGVNPQRRSAPWRGLRPSGSQNELRADSLANVDLFNFGF